jgi:hypothetical protein
MLVQMIQPQYPHIGFWAATSAKPDNTFWKKVEEILFRWITQCTECATILQIFSHLSFWGNVCWRRCCQLTYD